MEKKTNYRPYLIRGGAILAISLVFALVFNEATYLLQKDPSDRAPRTIELVIPEGTADQVEAGERTPSIPAELVFVVGDVLEVRNEDTVSHQLGPIWVPPGTTGRLVMEQVDRLSYSCSFQTDRYLGLEIRPPTTMGTRVAGLFLTVPTLATLLFLYSLAAYPLKKSSAPAPVREQA